MTGLADRLKSTMGNRLLLVVFGILILGGVFTAGIVWSSLDHVEQRRSYRAAIDQAARLSAENSRLEQDNDALRRRIVNFERQVQVNQIAYDKLTAQLSESSNYINSLREDLDFYQSIISPHDDQVGVKIQAWQVRSGESRLEYQYHVTLVQALNHDNIITGQMSIHIEGSRQGTVVRVPIEDLGDSPDALSFRYFQVVEGNFALPVGFEPASILVRISGGASDDESIQIERRFEWAVDR